MVFRHIPEILTNIPVEQQVHIVNRRIVHQPFQFAALVHILCNLGFHQSAVNGNHVSVSEFDLNTGGIDIEITGNSYRLSALIDSGRLMTPFRKWVSSNLPKKTNNPNPSPPGKTRFGLYWFVCCVHFRYLFSASNQRPFDIRKAIIPSACISFHLGEYLKLIIDGSFSCKVNLNTIAYRIRYRH